MTTIRVKHQSHYTVIANSAIRHNTVSLEARGLHHLLLSYPDNWQINVKHLVTQCFCGKDKIYKCIKELENHGYLVVSQKRQGDGRFQSNDYIVYETPFNGVQKVDISLEMDKPYSEDIFPCRNGHHLLTEKKSGTGNKISLETVQGLKTGDADMDSPDTESKEIYPCSKEPCSEFPFTGNPNVYINNDNTNYGFQEYTTSPLPPKKEKKERKEPDNRIGLCVEKEGNLETGSPRMKAKSTRGEGKKKEGVVEFPLNTKIQKTPEVEEISVQNPTKKHFPPVENLSQEAQTPKTTLDWNEFEAIIKSEVPSFKLQATSKRIFKDLAERLFQIDKTRIKSFLIWRLNALKNASAYKEVGCNLITVLRSLNNDFRYEPDKVEGWILEWESLQVSAIASKVPESIPMWERAKRSAR